MSERSQKLFLLDIVESVDAIHEDIINNELDLLKCQIREILISLPHHE